MKKITNYLGSKVSTNPILYYFLNFTWGIILTLIGYLLVIILLPFGRVKKFNYCLYFEFKKKTGWGFSLGTTFFVTNGASTRMLNHEYGHTVQNSLFGPLQIFLVAIPSVTRFWYWYLKYHLKNIKPKVSYDSVWFEGTATYIGEYYSNLKRRT